MALLDDINEVWNDETVQLANKWATQLMANKKKVKVAVTKFREWGPVHVYLSFTRATSDSLTFSLRYNGQEVASLSVSKEVKLVISEKTARNNSKYFGFEMAGRFDWNGVKAAEFRRFFKDPDLINKPIRVIEHKVESEFLKQMADKTVSKFSGTFKNIQPVLFAGCPFQFPLPIAGNTGSPVRKNGNIDILARRGTGKGTRISIWELKKPNTTAHAIEQAYIYAVTLIKMLQTDSANIWYQDIIGFKGVVPDSMTMECVLGVSLKSDKSKAAFVEKARQFTINNPMSVEFAKIKFYVAHYKESPLTVELIEV